MKTRWKQRWRAIKAILRNDYFLLFTFNNKFGVNVTTHVADGIPVHRMVGEVITAIKHEDYLQGE